MSYLVFISHAYSDRWVAGQIGNQVAALGAEFFLDSKDAESGDVISETVRTALKRADELLVLFTPASVERPYVWIEIGGAWGDKKRIVGVLYGLTTSELARRDGWPRFLSDVLLRDINEFDEYLEELKNRLPDG